MNQSQIYPNFFVNFLMQIVGDFHFVWKILIHLLVVSFVTGMNFVGIKVLPLPFLFLSSPFLSFDLPLFFFLSSSFLSFNFYAINSFLKFCCVTYAIFIPYLLLRAGRGSSHQSRCRGASKPIILYCTA
jgi:hypothetical protein